jgi:hypothetical protein
VKEGRIENSFYTCSINERGEIHDVLLNDNKALLFGEPANKLSATFADETVITFEPEPGSFMQRNGAVYDVITCRGKFDKSFYRKEIRAYKKIPRIDFTTTFNFHHQQIGNGFLDEKKLCTTWPARNLKMIKHDIPFGTVEGRKSRPLFALNWIHCELDSNAWFTILPRGKIKFFEKDGILYNLLAWGDEGVDYMRVGGECAPEIMQGSFDLKMDGEHRFEYSLYIHDSKPSMSDLFHISSAYTRPFRSRFSDVQLKPMEDVILQLKNGNVSSTSIFREGRQIKCRFFECGGESATIDIDPGDGIVIDKIVDLWGDRIKTLKPFKIGVMNIDSVTKKSV